MRRHLTGSWRTSASSVTENELIRKSINLLNNSLCVMIIIWKKKLKTFSLWLGAIFIVGYLLTNSKKKNHLTPERGLSVALSNEHPQLLDTWCIASIIEFGIRQSIFKCFVFFGKMAEIRSNLDSSSLFSISVFLEITWWLMGPYCFSQTVLLVASLLLRYRSPGFDPDSVYTDH